MNRPQTRSRGWGGRTRKLLTVGALTGLIGGLGVGQAWAGPYDPPVDPQVEQLAELPAGGTSVPYSPASESSAEGDVSAQAMGPLVAPVNLGCPAGTTAYPPPNDIYSCVAVYGDNANRGDSAGGFDVGMRAGRADPSGFGLLHAAVDHNLAQRTLAYVVVNNAEPRYREDGRLDYGLTYEYADVGILSIEVIVEPAVDDLEMTPDNSAFGLTTAYCVGVNVCPDGVNASFP